MRQLRNTLLFLSALGFIIFASQSLRGLADDAPALKEIYIVPILGHLDLGFTAPQRDARRLWPGLYRDGIESLKKDPGARLTSGCLLPVEWFREDASPGEWRDFVELVKSGRWELTSGFAHMNTAMMSEAEESRFFMDSRRWEDELGVTIRTWLHADVPGLAWNMAEAATDSEMRFIVVGANELGGLSRLPDLPRLFRWEAPDGEKIVLSLHGGNGYMEGGLDLKIHVPDGLGDRLERFERRIREKGYGLDFAMVLFSSGDNRGPEIFRQLFKTVAQWNKAGRLPRLRVASFSDFYECVKKHERELPVVRGDWPAAWEALVMRGPRGRAAIREAQRNIRAIEALSVVNNAHDSLAIDRIWRNILLRDEHSGTGAWPGLLSRGQAIEQNRTEYLYAQRALEQSRFLMNEDMLNLSKRIKPADFRKFLFFNYTSHGHDGSFADVAMKKSAGYTPGIGYRVAGIQGGKRAGEDKYRPFFGKVELQISGRKSFEEAEKIHPYRFAARDYFVENILFHIPMRRPSGRFSLFAVHQREGASEIAGYMRNGLWIANDLNLRGRAGGYLYTNGGLFYREKGRSILVSSMAGAPFKLEGSKLLSLLYIQEPPALLKGGERAYIDPEPEVEDGVHSGFFIEYMGNNKLDNTEIMAELDEAAYPVVAQRGLYGGIGENSLPHKAVFLTTDNPRVWVAELKWADFGDGVIVRLRNVSEKVEITGLKSEFWLFTSVNLTDALERDIEGDELFCRDKVNRKSDCASAAGIRPFARLDPKEVVTLRLGIRTAP